MIEISKIRIDGGTQPRGELHSSAIEEYAEAYLAGDQFPPVTLFYDGDDYWLADGFHRVAAAKAAGKTEVCEHIIPGTRRDAILFAVSANAQHGLRRSNADKRRAVEMLLRDDEWSKWSSREIARRCAVHHQMVEEIRRSYLDDHPDSDQEFTRTVQRNGTTYEQDVSNIGKSADSETPKERKPKPAMVSEERAAEILAENAELREQMETVARDAQETLADNESMAKIFEADDKLAAAMAEIERLRAEVNALKWQLNGAINKGNEAIKTAKAYQRKAEKLEKMLKAAGIAE